jgi:hypothetical protein
VRIRRLSTIVLLAGACALPGSLTAAPAAAAAGSSNPVIADCLSHPGGLQGHYTVAELKHALEVMSAETKEYTSCPDVIDRALLAALGSGGSGGGTSTGGGSGGSFLPTPVIIVLVVLVLAAVTFGALAIRRGRGPGPDDPSGGAAVGAEPHDGRGGGPDER